MPKHYLYPYNAASQGAKELQLEIGAVRIRKENSKFKGAPNKAVINWGCSVLPTEVMKATVFNDPERVGMVTNKRRFFEMLNECGTAVSVPLWTLSKDEAGRWLEEKRCTIFARTKLTGHSGDGIVEVTNQQELDAIRDGTLLVKYVPKKDEFRLHFTAFDGLIDVQRKARRHSAEDPNWRIRNHKNGFIYARSNQQETPKVVVDEATKAFNASGLDFGAVDVLYNAKHDKGYVLEINTAPGLEGTTIRKYGVYLARMVADRMDTEKPPVPPEYNQPEVENAIQVMNDAPQPHIRRARWELPIAEGN